MKILLIDDDHDLREAISVGLSLQLREVEVETAEDGRMGLAAWERSSPDLILLDVTMPGLGGFDVLREIRRRSDVPVIMLTARDEEIDRVRGLELGADDYVGKPFGHLELVARIRAVLRRMQATVPAGAAPSVRAGDLAIHFETHEVTRGGQPVSLTPTEYRLLYELAANAGRVQLQDSLLSRVWGEEFEAESDYLKVYINRLRRKLEADPTHPRIILTERGIGYRFVRDR
jgi:two-component system KDP operon response regulator KdpE